MNQSFNNSTTPFSIISLIPIGFTWSSVSRVIVTAFSILTNFVNIIVFVNPKLKDPSYSYMLTIAISNFLYSIFTHIYVVTFYCLACATYNTYFSSLFSIYFGNYAAAALGLFRITIECMLSLNTLCILTNRTWLTTFSQNSLKFFILISLFLISSAVLYSFVPFGHYIGTYVDSKGNTRYTDSFSSFISSPFSTNMSIAVGSLRILLIVLVECPLNILNVIEFRKRYGAKITRLASLSTNTKRKSLYLGCLRKKYH
jgi:hypothetical protein